MTFRLAPLVLAIAPGIALAAPSPVETRDFVEHDVVALNGRAEYQSTIEFGEGERIENVAVGESGTWQVTPNRRANLLFVKPLSARATATNMTVVTDRHTYLFELRASATAQPLYLLRFIYPDAPPAVAPADEAPGDGLIPVSANVVAIDRLNFGWTMKGSSKLLPARCFDDGEAVYLAWPAGRALPAILSIGPDGKTEGPVNYTAKGEFLVVEGFHSRIVLRSGKEVATLRTDRTPPADAASTALAE